MDWTAIVIMIIQLIIAPLIIWGVKEGVSYLRKKADSELLDSYFARAEDAILTAVAETQQTFVDALKKSPDWNKAAMREAFNLSISRAQQIMGAATYETIAAASEDINAWITAKIEQAVHEQKWLDKPAV